MAEVIDLTISSPTSIPGVTLPSPRPEATPQADIVELGSDDFRFSQPSRNLDVPLSQTSKRRKLGLRVPSRRISRPFHADANDIEIFSDDTDLPNLFPHNARAASSDGELRSLPSDPIHFTSSAPESTELLRTSAKAGSSSNNVFLDQTAAEFPFSNSQPMAKSTARAHLSERTANVLAVIGSRQGQKASRRAGPSTKSIGYAKLEIHDEIESSSPADLIPTKSSKAQRLNKAEQAAKVESRAKLKAAKEAEKEAGKEQKRLAREAKSLEKQKAAEIVEVNKAKTDKKASVTEMMIDLPNSIKHTSVGHQVVDYMRHLEVDVTFCPDDIEEIEPLDDSEAGPSALCHVIRWRRKVRAEFKEELGLWQPLPVPRIEKEHHVLIHLAAEDFAEIATGTDVVDSNHVGDIEAALAKNLDAHVSAVLRRSKASKPIYLIEGLTSWLRKIQTAKNRTYTAAVRAQIPTLPEPAPAASAPSQARPRKRKVASRPVLSTSPFDANLVDSLLLHLQLGHPNLLIHQTTNPTTSAEWIKAFTEHVSTIPYRLERLSANTSSFCMDVGQVKTGEDARDTYLKMLQEVQRVTPSMAYGIANHYSTLMELVQAYRREGPLMLEDVRKSANKDGGITHARIGPAVSKRLYKVFMGRNPASTDGIT